MNFNKPICPNCSEKLEVKTLVKLSHKGNGSCPKCNSPLIGSGWGYSILCFLPGLFTLMTIGANPIWPALGIISFISCSYIYYVNMGIFRANAN